MAVAVGEETPGYADDLRLVQYGRGLAADQPARGSEGRTTLRRDGWSPERAAPENPLDRFRKGKTRRLPGEGGRILRGQTEPSRSYEIAEPIAAAVRERYGLSQREFAALLGISVRTLQNWEQGGRRPQGPARILLRVAAEHPEAVWDTIKKAS